jgi:23S rRNA (adenine1618-N6)-methyltransferase
MNSSRRTLSLPIKVKSTGQKKSGESSSKSKKHPHKQPNSLHPKNPHTGRYDLDQLCLALPELTQFIQLNPRDEKTIDFSNPEAVKLLNKALLKQFYNIEFWDIPKNYLCPPIPGRADYIHYIADLLSHSNQNKPVSGKKIHGLDIGTGANLIYPLLAHKSYGWRMTGSEIDPVSIKSANTLIQANHLEKTVKVIRQAKSSNIFKGVLTPDSRYHFTLCNPPFHSSAEEAQAGTCRKIRNLDKSSINQKTKPASEVLNFGGQSNELWCEGGELAFIKQMIRESSEFKDQCLWFTTLVSKKDNLPAIYRTLKKQHVASYKEIKMAQGQKVSRFVAWTFQPKDQHTTWFTD